MSQINQFIKQVENIAQQCNGIQEKMQQVLRMDLGETTAIPAEVEAWKRHCAKFREDLLLLKEETSKKLGEKLNQVDPVTGSKRYGAQTQQKFLIADQQLDAIIDQFLPVNDEMEAHILRIEQTIAEEKTRAERIRLQQELERKESEEKRLQLEREAEEQLRRQRQQEEEEKAELLRSQAEAVRKRKLEESEALSRINQQLTQILESKVQELNATLFYQKSLMEKYLSLIKEFCRDHSERCTLRSFSTMIIGNVFDRIIAKPDDLQARRLRVNHPTLQARLTGVRGAIQLLLIAGFKLVMKPHVDQPAAPTSFNALLAAAQAAITSGKPFDPTSLMQEDKKEEVPEKQYITQENKGSYEQALARLTQVQVEDDLLPILSPLLYPQSPWELLLEMEEPAIEDLVLTASTTGSKSDTTDFSQKKLSWIEWYDRLKADSETIQKSLH